MNLSCENDSSMAAVLLRKKKRRKVDTPRKASAPRNGPQVIRSMVPEEAQNCKEQVLNLSQFTAHTGTRSITQLGAVPMTSVNSAIICQRLETRP